MRSFLVASTVLCFMFCAAARADTWFSSTIYYVYPHSDGMVVLTFNTPSPACINSDYHQLKIGHNSVTADGYRAILAVAIAAAAAGRTVEVNFDESSAECYINRIAVRH